MNYQLDLLAPFGAQLTPKKQNDSLSVLNMPHLRELFCQHQLILLRGFSTFKNNEDFCQFCELWGNISLWPFGKILELIEQDTPADHIFDHSYMPLHWDGMYRLQIPEYQIFHCVNAPLPGQGGRTTFSNTILALNSASAEEKKLWSKVTGTYKRKMEFYDSKTASPIITKHPYKDISIIRYNEPVSKDKHDFINPPEQTFTGVNHDELEALHQSLQKALYAPANFYAHEWQSGDIVIADNLSLLHGREAFVTQSPRHLQRIHVLSNPPFDNPGLESYQ